MPEQLDTETPTILNLPDGSSVDIRSPDVLLWIAEGENAVSFIVGGRRHRVATIREYPLATLIDLVEVEAS